MNTRDYKQCAPGEYYHIYNRGNAKGEIFRDSEDYSFFLHRATQILGVLPPTTRWFQPLPPNAFSVIAYCLMPNHFHFLIRQNSDTPTSSLISRVCTGYAKYFNKKYDRVGHLFQDQFKQKNVQDNGNLLWLSAYIHQNPVMAAIAQEASRWRWSSMGAYLSKGNIFVDPGVVLAQLEGNTYESWLRESVGKIDEHVVEFG